MGATDGGLKLSTERLDLELRHTFRLARGASDSRSNLVVELDVDGVVGRGEAAPIARYGQDWRSAAAAAETMVGRLGSAQVFRQAALHAAVPGEPAAQAAIDMALWDLAGQRSGLALYELLGLDRSLVPPTSLTLGIDAPEVMPDRVREAEGFEVIKLKLGGDNDRELFEAVRSATGCAIRVDANEGWTLEEAKENVVWLADQGVEFVEQPLPADDLAGMRALREVSPLPLMADESVATATDIPRLVGAFDGINIKLMKCGGLGEALDMIATARALGLKVMLGCMIESSLAITAAAHLSPLVDYADLDGNLLVANDPFVGAVFAEGRLCLPYGPGLGVSAREPC